MDVKLTSDFKCTSVASSKNNFNCTIIMMKKSVYKHWTDNNKKIRHWLINFHCFFLAMFFFSFKFIICYFPLVFIFRSTKCLWLDTNFRYYRHSLLFTGDYKTRRVDQHGENDKITSIGSTLKYLSGKYSQDITKIR